MAAPPHLSAFPTGTLSLAQRLRLSVLSRRAGIYQDETDCAALCGCKIAGLLRL